jgi:short-subunit dehydrogenase
MRALSTHREGAWFDTAVELRGRRVLVTGASRGIGRSLAYAFAEEGARVALVARSADAIAKLAADTGGDAYPADLCDRAATGPLLGVVEADGPVDVLVNNAGIDATGRYADMSRDDLDALVQINLLAPMHLCRDAARRMVARGHGHIVNVSSLAAMIPFPGLTAYGASKAGLSRFTAGLRGELRGSGVGTTLVELGGVRTGMVEHTRAYAPTQRSWARVERLALSVDLEPAMVARHVVRAVRRGRPHVWLPRRAGLYPLLAQAPWHITDALLVGVDRHTDEATT